MSEQPGPSEQDYLDAARAHAPDIGAVVGYPDEMVATVVSALAFDAFGDAYTDTQRVLDALSSAGYLMPEGSEEREEFGVRLAHQSGRGWAFVEVYDDQDDADSLTAYMASVCDGRQVLTMRRIAVYGPWTPVDGEQDQQDGDRFLRSEPPTFTNEPVPGRPGVVRPVLSKPVRMDPETGAVEWDDE